MCCAAVVSDPAGKAGVLFPLIRWLEGERRSPAGAALATDLLLLPCPESSGLWPGRDLSAGREVARCFWEPESSALEGGSDGFRGQGEGLGSFPPALCCVLCKRVRIPFLKEEMKLARVNSVLNDHYNNFIPL